MGDSGPGGTSHAEGVPSPSASVMAVLAPPAPTSGVIEGIPVTTAGRSLRSLGSIPVGIAGLTLPRAARGSGLPTRAGALPCGSRFLPARSAAGVPTVAVTVAIAMVGPTTSAPAIAGTARSGLPVGIDECLRDLAGQACELDTLPFLQDIEGVIPLRTGTGGLLGCSATLSRQTHQGGSAVLLIALPGDQSCVLQFAQQLAERLGADAQQVGQVLLPQRFAQSQKGENPTLTDPRAAPMTTGPGEVFVTHEQSTQAHGRA